MMTAGAAVAALTVLIMWILLPLAERWSALGARLHPELQALERLEERVARRQALQSRRARLVRQLGYLYPPSQPAEDDEQEGAEGPKNTEAGDPEPSEAPKQEGSGKGTPAPPALEAELEKAAKECGVGVKRISAERNSRASGRGRRLRIRTLRIEAECTMDALVKLLHALEKGPRFVRVESLKVRHDLKKPLAVKVTIEASAYEAVPPAEGSA
jgi:hypothetical protein